MTTIPGYYTQERKEMIAFLPLQYGTVLEIGCGEGTFAANLKPNCEIWAVEPNGAAAEKASHRMQKVLVGTYDQVVDQLPDAYFELVICNDVIEHMGDHYAFLDSIKNKMKRDSYLVGSVPNVRCYSNLKNLLLRRDWEYVDAGILDGTHQRFFTEISLRRTLEQHGFSIERLQGINKVQFNMFSILGFVQCLAMYLAVAVTVGYYNDIRFGQFGFRVRPLSSNGKPFQPIA